MDSKRPGSGSFKAAGCVQRGLNRSGIQRTLLATIRVIRVSILMSLLAISTAAFSGESQAGGSDELERALAAAREGDARGAIRILDQVRLQGPAAAAGWRRLGGVLFDFGRFPEALECFRRWAEVDPDDGRSHALWGLAQFRLGDYERALIYLQRGRLRGLEAGSDLAVQARLTSGLLLNRMGEHQAAFETLEPFALGGSLVEDALLGLGLSTLQLAMLPSEIPPDLRAPVRLAGEATWAAAAHQFEAADRLYRRLLSQYPDLAGANYAYGVFLMRDRRQDGLARFESELARNPWHVPSLLQLAFEAVEQGDGKRGLALAQRAEALDPGSFKVQYALGWAQLESGDAAAAVRSLESAVRLEPGVPEPRFMLARAYQRVGRFQDAARERAEFQRLSDLKREIRERVRQ